MLALIVTLCFALTSAVPLESTGEGKIDHAMVEEGTIDYKLEVAKIGYDIRIPHWANKIIGGEAAHEGQFPYQVSLQYSISGLYMKHFCGGSIITNRWVMTAAHCVRAIPSSGTVVVKAGKLRLKTKEPHEQTVKVHRSYVHEKYSGGVAPYDVAMIYLETPLTFNEYVQPISLPSAGVEHTGQVLLSGWGSITPKKFLIPDNLQFVELPLIDLQTCRNAIDSIVNQNPLHSTNVCTGPLSGGHSPCAGDSGGPLVQKNLKTGQLEVVGIVSWGIVPCGLQGAPAVYTKTSAHSDWIALTMSTY